MKLFTTSLFLFLFSSLCNAQQKIECRNDTLFIDTRPIYKGLEMKLGKPESRIFQFVEMGQTKLMTSKAPVLAWGGETIKIVSDIINKKEKFSFKCKPQESVSGASKAILNSMQSIWVTDISKALETKELFFKD